jgi:Calcium-binding EGF domain.
LWSYSNFLFYTSCNYTFINVHLVLWTFINVHLVDSSKSFFNCCPLVPSYLVHTIIIPFPKVSRKENTPNYNILFYFLRCPPENECLNDHHTCDPQSEQCVDLADGFECVCGRGYNKSEEGGECVPVCSQGCVRGVCSEPDKCQCDFG